MDGDATDISNSPAFVALDALLMEGKLSQAVVDMYKSKYAELHDYVIQTYEREKNLLTRAKVESRVVGGANSTREAVDTSTRRAAGTHQPRKRKRASFEGIA